MTLKTPLSLITLTLASVISIQAQTPPTIQWQQSFGGSGSDECRVVKQTTDGGYILGGYSNSGISGNKTSANYGNYDYWVVKMDGSGNKVWDKSFGGGSADVLHSLQQTSDGGYILGGYSNSGVSGNKTNANNGSFDYWVVKIDDGGNKVWDKCFGGSSNNILYSLQQASDGGYILGGYSNSGISGNKSSTNYGGFDFWVVKIDGSGNKVWDNSFGGSNTEVLYNLQQTSDGGYILGGHTTNKASSLKGSADYWIVKIDGSGNKVWDNWFGSSWRDVLYSLKQTSDNGYMLGGYSYFTGTTNYGGNDYWAVKMDENGNKNFDISFGGSRYDVLQSLQQMSDDGYIFGGHSDSGVSGNKSSENFGSSDYWVVKTDPSGNKEWDLSLGGSGTDELFSLQHTTDDGYILGGRSSSGISGNKTAVGYGNFDYWIVKLGMPLAATTNGLVKVTDTTRQTLLKLKARIE